MDLSSK